MMKKKSSLMPLPSEVDAVASFVEVVEDLAREPFMSKDESRVMSFSANKGTTFKLGDRTHFRSALISFRRIWMAREPSCYKNICDILFKCDENTRPWTQAFRQDVDELRRESAWLVPNVRTEELIDLWLNTVFAHGGLNAAKRINRARFDGLVDEVGLGKMEYCFRMAVFRSSLSFINLCQHAARPALGEWGKLGLKPSFLFSSPFGQKMRERLADGTIIIRQASSKYYTEETLDRRFIRILERRQSSGIKFVFDHIDASITGKALLALRSSSVHEILRKLDYSYSELPEDLIISDVNSLIDPINMVAFSAVSGKRNKKNCEKPIYFDSKYTFFASRQAISLLDEELAQITLDFKNEN